MVYEFECRRCGKVEEIKVSSEEVAEIKPECCGEEMKRKFSILNLNLKFGIEEPWDY